MLEAIVLILVYSLFPLMLGFALADDGPQSDGWPIFISIAGILWFGYMIYFCIKFTIENGGV